MARKEAVGVEVEEEGKGCIEEERCGVIGLACLDQPCGA